MKVSTTARWLLLVGLFSAPYAVVLVAGSIWLHARGWFWGWLVLNALVTLLLWYLVRRWHLQFDPVPPNHPRVQPDPRWTPAGEAAWRDVRAIAARTASAELPLDDIAQLWQVVQEVLDAVARHFHPRSRRPTLEIPVPYVLRIVELVAADLRVAFSEHVPGSHILTLHDLQRMKRLAALSQQLYFLYRIARVGMDPVSAVLREAREAAGGKLARDSTAEIKRWAIEYTVQKTGHYAIQLYSGQLILRDGDVEAFPLRRAKQDEQHAQRRDTTLAAEPLRVLVLGQVKAGKSSLINALFGETRAAVDVVPRTKQVEPYVLERDGLQRAIILDTAGFAEGASDENPFTGLRQEVLDSDLVLLVTSATSAARAPDKKLLDDLRAFFQGEPNRILPPVVVVLTHVDKLRPWQEWQPPFDLVRAADIKSRNIVSAIQQVAADLQVTAEGVIPVCLAEGRVYNIDDGLVPAILHALPEAQRVKYQRCLRQFRGEEYWGRLWQQAVNSGRWLRKAITAGGSPMS